MAAKKKSKTTKAKPKAKKVMRAPAKTKMAAKPAKPAAAKNLLGTVNHFFDKISVAVVDLKQELKIGDTIKFEGPSTHFSQKVTSMQIEYDPVKVAKKGASVGMKVVKPVRKKDMVFKA